MSDLDRLLDDIRRWHKEVIAPNIDTHGSWAKVDEEFHELAEAVERLNESDLYLIGDTDYRELVEAWKKEMADLFISLVCYADFCLVNLERRVAEAHWQNINRTWTKREDGSMHHD